MLKYGLPALLVAALGAAVLASGQAQKTQKPAAKKSPARVTSPRQAASPGSAQVAASVDGKPITWDQLIARLRKDNPQALTASVDNAERNAVANRLAVFLPENFDGAPADVFVANILAGPLGELAPTFAAAARPGAPFAISGILDGQQDELLARYGEWFDELRVDRREDWVRISGHRR